MDGAGAVRDGPTSRVRRPKVRGADGHRHRRLLALFLSYSRPASSFEGQLGPPDPVGRPPGPIQAHHRDHRSRCRRRACIEPDKRQDLRQPGQGHRRPVPDRGESRPEPAGCVPAADHDLRPDRDDSTDPAGRDRQASPSNRSWVPSAQGHRDDGVGHLADHDPGPRRRCDGRSRDRERGGRPADRLLADSPGRSGIRRGEIRRRGPRRPSRTRSGPPRNR